MSIEMKEKPGIQTPWKDINQLLGPDERFEIQNQNGTNILLAPKHASQLAALLYILHQKQLSFIIQGKSSMACRNGQSSLIISARAFSNIKMHGKNVVEIGAGCQLSQLHQFLYEQKQEVPLDGDPLSSLRRSVGGFILSGKSGGIRYKRESIPETILGVELITCEGSQIKWGGFHRSALAGPHLHRLIWGLNSIPGIIVKIILKTYSIPQIRLRLAWSFHKKENLQEHLHSLKIFSSDWECLDSVQSGLKNDRGFIFAQISGFQEEMEAFSKTCPGFIDATQLDTKNKLKKFLKDQKLNAYSSLSNQQLESGEYLWIHELDQCAWWITPRVLTEEIESKPLWKKRLISSLCNQSEEDGWMKNT